MNILSGILNALMILISLFLICLVLIQRGKGGGLAGAFGGMGGSSAFGTKAGDVFTRVTMISAVVWILLSMILVKIYNRGTESAWGSDTRATTNSRTREVPPTAPAGSGSGTSKAPVATPATVPPNGKAAAAPSSGSSPAPVRRSERAAGPVSGRRAQSEVIGQDRRGG